MSALPTTSSRSRASRMRAASIGGRGRGSAGAAVPRISKPAAASHGIEVCHRPERRGSNIARTSQDRAGDRGPTRPAGAQSTARAGIPWHGSEPRPTISGGQGPHSLPEVTMAIHRSLAPALAVVALLSAPALAAPLMRFSWNDCDPLVTRRDFTGPDVYTQTVSALGLDAAVSSFHLLMRVNPSLPNAWVFADLCGGFGCPGLPC